MSWIERMIDRARRRVLPTVISQGYLQIDPPTPPVRELPLSVRIAKVLSAGEGSYRIVEVRVNADPAGNVGDVQECTAANGLTDVGAMCLNGKATGKAGDLIPVAWGKQVSGGRNTLCALPHARRPEDVGLGDAASAAWWIDVQSNGAVQGLDGDMRVWAGHQIRPSAMYTIGAPDDTLMFGDNVVGPVQYRDLTGAWRDQDSRPGLTWVDNDPLVGDVDILRWLGGAGGGADVIVSVHSSTGALRIRVENFAARCQFWLWLTADPLEGSPTLRMIGGALEPYTP